MPAKLYEGSEGEAGLKRQERKQTATWKLWTGIWRRKRALGIGLIIVGAWLCSCCFWTVSLSRTSLNVKSLLEWEQSLLIVHLKPCSYPYLLKMESCRTGSISWNSDPWSSWYGLTGTSSFQGCPLGGGFKFLVLSPWVLYTRFATTSLTHRLWAQKPGKSLSISRELFVWQ